MTDSKCTGLMLGLNTTKPMDDINNFSLIITLAMIIIT